MQMKLWSPITILLFLCVSLAATAHASVVLQLSDQQMTTQADRIVRAKVIQKISRWDKKTKRVYTYVKLVVLDPIKGSKGAEEVTIRLMGGSANGVGMHISGSPSFKLGEEVVVFLEKVRQAPKFHHVMGMAYGKFQVVMDTKNKVQMLVRHLKGVSLARRTPKGTFSIQHGHELKHQPVQLSTFVGKIKGYLRAARLKKKPSIAVPQLKKSLRPSVVPQPKRPLLPKQPKK